MCAEYIKRSLNFVRDHSAAMALFLLIVIWLATASAFFFGDFGHRNALAPVTLHHAAVPSPRKKGLNIDIPKSCLHKDECLEKPRRFDYDKYVEELYQKNMLLTASGPPSIKATKEYFTNQKYINDIIDDSKYVTIYLLKDTTTKKLKYLIPQSEKHNQTLRVVFCDVPSKVICNSMASRTDYETFVVQKYSRIIMDAVDVETEQIVKLIYPYKTGCICRYRPKKQEDVPPENGNKL